MPNLLFIFLFYAILIIIGRFIFVIHCIGNSNHKCSNYYHKLSFDPMNCGFGIFQTGFILLFIHVSNDKW